ncbi:MAG: metal-dependent hydrolase [Pseudomonadota bacterium]
MKITWYGHSAFGVELGDNRILIDPFLEGNPSWNGGWQEPAEGCTHVLLTHGHDDHIGNALDICIASGAMLVANFEICMYLVGKGLPDNRINPGNHGGTVDCGGFTTTFVNAVHSSSIQSGEGLNVYLGNPAGLIIKSANEKTLYHMGDTDIFGDMALINELHDPAIGIVPIGDRFTMGASEAALACNRFFDFETVIPCHFGTFPIIDQSADAFTIAMGDKSGSVSVMQVGGSIER